MRFALVTGFLLAGITGFSGNAIAQQSEMISAEVVHTKPVELGRRSPVQLSIKHKETGAPVTLDQLDVVHTKPIHLLIADPSLEDYHHVHPTESATAGEYLFIMKPNTECGYRVWVDVTPTGEEQQYATADIPGAKDCKDAKINKTEVTEWEGNGYSYKIEFDKPLQAGENTMAKLTVRDSRGRLFYKLEPVLGAFAHMVGFYEDYENIAHIHPMGDEPDDADSRGGPYLEFHIRPEHSGFTKLYAQFYMDGRDHFVPFAVNVQD